MVFIFWFFFNEGYSFECKVTFFEVSKQLRKTVRDEVVVVSNVAFFAFYFSRKLLWTETKLSTFRTNFLTFNFSNGVLLGKTFWRCNFLKNPSPKPLQIQSLTGTLPLKSYKGPEKERPMSSNGIMAFRGVPFQVFLLD